MKLEIISLKCKLNHLKRSSDGNVTAANLGQLSSRRLHKIQPEKPNIWSVFYSLEVDTTVCGMDCRHQPSIYLVKNFERFLELDWSLVWALFFLDVRNCRENILHILNCPIVSGTQLWVSKPYFEPQTPSHA